MNLSGYKRKLAAAVLLLGPCLLISICVVTVGPSVPGWLHIQTPTCQALFRLGPRPDDDSLPPAQHTPPEALDAVAEREFPDVEAEVRQRYAPQCQAGLPVLPAETIEEAPGSDPSTHLSLSGRLMALGSCCGEGEGIDVIDLATRARRRVSDQYDYILFWGSETELFLEGEGEQEPYRLDVQSGAKTLLAEYWEYQGPEPERLVGEFYTGWQAASLLDVEPEVICRAANGGTLTPVAASDGSLLLTRSDILDHSAQVVQEEFPSVLSREEVLELRRTAGQVRATRNVWRGAPIQYTDWPYALILTALPDSPHDRLIFVNDEVPLGDVPLITNQLTIYGADHPQDPDAHPRFFVAPNPCPDPGGYRYVLYRKPEAGESATPVGILPYPVQALTTQAIWSPDWQYIYIVQSAFGRYSVSRVRLPEP